MCLYFKNVRRGVSHFYILLSFIRLSTNLSILHGKNPDYFIITILLIFYVAKNILNCRYSTLKKSAFISLNILKLHSYNRTYYETFNSVQC